MKGMENKKVTILKIDYLYAGSIFSVLTELSVKCEFQRKSVNKT